MASKKIYKCIIWVPSDALLWQSFRKRKWMSYVHEKWVLEEHRTTIKEHEKGGSAVLFVHHAFNVSLKWEMQFFIDFIKPTKYHFWKMKEVFTRVTRKWRVHSRKHLFDQDAYPMGFFYPYTRVHQMYVPT